MESGINKSINLDKIFGEVEESFKIYRSRKYSGEYKSLSVKIVGGLLDILKTDPKMIESEISRKVCEIVDRFSEEESVWSLSKFEREGDILISFLKELAARGCIKQIDKIFRSGGGNYPLVNYLSCNYEEKFFEMFSMLPKDYQSELLSETVRFSEGDKDYTYTLIGGTALMGF